MQSAIFNNSAPPRELLEHNYRKLFGLTYQQMLDEPAFVIYEALYIEQLLQERQQDEIKSAERQR